VRLAFVVMLGLLFAACAPARSPYHLDYAFPLNIELPTEKYRLANGLEVILHTEHANPLVAVSLWYHVGSKDDPPGRAGMAHLFEHLMFDGSRHVGAGQHEALLARTGADNVNATTSRDRTEYHETVPAAELELAFWLESDRMAFLLDSVNQATLDRERAVVKNELRLRYDNASYGRLPAFMYSALYDDKHSYHALPIGDEAQLDAVTLDDIRAFYRAFYVPSDATIVLAGDFDPAIVKEMIEKYFGPIAPGKPGIVKRAPQPSSIDRERRLIIEAEVERPMIQAMWSVPPLFAPGSPEIALGADALGGIVSYVMVKQDKVAERVSTWVDDGEIASSLGLTVTLRPEVSPEQAMSKLDWALDHARGQRARFDQVMFAINRAKHLSSLVYEAEELESRANLLNRYNHYRGSPAYVGTELTRRSEVTPEAAHEALVEFLPFNRRVLALVTPTKGAPRAGRLVASR
jgi:predicted Zn-dependent peptidase